MEEDFDIFLGKNKKFSSYEKILNVLSVISNTENNIEEIERDTLVELLDKLFPLYSSIEHELYLREQKSINLSVR